jgi:hypothetical protein
MGLTKKEHRVARRNGLHPIHGPLSSHVPMRAPPGAGIYDEFQEDRTPMQKNWLRPIKDKELARKPEVAHIHNKFKSPFAIYGSQQIGQNPNRVITRRSGMTRFNAVKGHEVKGPLIQYPKTY